jgi:hypothetical protein
VSSRERNGRILLAVAVGLLFLVVVLSMIAGGPFWPGIVLVGLMAATGGLLMATGAER